MCVCVRACVCMHACMCALQYSCTTIYTPHLFLIHFWLTSIAKSKLHTELLRVLTRRIQWHAVRTVTVGHTVHLNCYSKIVSCSLDRVTKGIWWVYLSSIKINISLHSHAVLPPTPFYTSTNSTHNHTQSHTLSHTIISCPSSLHVIGT